MSIWLEIHCDVGSDTPDPSRSYSDRTCYGHQNAFPSSGGVTTQEAYGSARRKANATGWKRRRFEWGTGWVCPHCRKFPPTEETK